MTKTTKKSSAKRKLIPAVGMLTTSAIMLSSATYAWFTMNKEVEVTGLQMSATSSQSLEISLGSVAENGALTISAPGMNDYSWARAISVGQYYSCVGKLKPASSDTALKMYKVDETLIKAGGRSVDSTAEVSTLDAAPSASNGPATLLAQTTYTSGGSLAAFDGDDSATKDGYYIDIPMWLRSSELKSHKIKCSVTITDPDDTNGSDLIEAVRVAIVPVGTSNTSADINTIAGGATSTVGGSINLSSLTGGSYIFGRPFTADTNHATQHYNTNQVIGGNITSGATFGESLVSAPTIQPAATSLITTDVNGNTSATAIHASDTPATDVFVLPAATRDDYATQAFVARVWIEGQSTYCNDATANQDWQIDFHFELGDEVSGT
ncbi:MAG: hypothetical protein ACI4JD_09075 [Ruminococcus sp.]